MRRSVSRVLLVALAATVGVAVWRLAGGGRGGAVVALDGLHAEALAHQAFRLDGPARLAVDAAGSFEEHPDTTLAALGWIVRRTDGTVVWRQRPGRRPRRGLVSAVRDTVQLAAGEYDAYFASYGDPVVRAAARRPRPARPALRERIREALSRGGRAWQGESGRWHLRVTGVTGDDRDRATPLDDRPTAAARPGDAWASGALGSNRRTEALLRVSAPATVTIDAVLEATGRAVADSAALVRVGGDAVDTVWAFRGGGTAAGGSVKNRHVRTRVRLAPGLYRAVVRTDGAHAPGDWTANPPWAPWRWGVRIERGDTPAEAVAEIRLGALAEAVRAGTSGLPVLAEMRCVGTSRVADATVVLPARTDVLVVGQGEITDDAAYDFGTLLRGAATVWTMDRNSTEAAGGDDRNRRDARLLSLAPGSYTLRYQTDSSHDCEDRYASGGAPDGPDFWGAALVALDPALDLSAVRRSGPVTTAVDDPAAPNSQPAIEIGGDSLATADDAPGDVLVDFARVGNDARLERAFTLAAATRVRIVAAGELLPSGPLDTGWIENADGERVWELSRANSVPAGGQPKNRRFDGVLTLAPGRYTAHYATDGRHAFGAFDGPGPDDPDAWGLRVETVREP